MALAALTECSPTAPAAHSQVRDGIPRTTGWMWSCSKAHSVASLRGRSRTDRPHFLSQALPCAAHPTLRCAPAARCKMPRRSRIRECPAINGSAESGKQRSWAHCCWAWFLPKLTGMTSADRESAKPRQTSTSRFADMGVTAGRPRSAGKNSIASATSAIGAAGSSSLRYFAAHRGSNHYCRAFSAALSV